MAKKYKTNRQLLTELIHHLDDVELGILRERIWSAADEACSNEKEIMETMKHSIISPKLYLDAMRKTLTLIGNQHE